MLLLNVGCGYPRLPEPFTNVDTLDAQLSAVDSDGARRALENLRSEPNYVEYNLSTTPWPWESESVDGVLASHFLEHFDTQAAVRLLRECFRIIRPGGCLRVSVPDAAFFRSVHDRDRRENWMEVFGEGNHVGPETAYRSVALFFHEHLQTYTADALWCQLVEAGFNAGRIYQTCAGGYSQVTAASVEMARHDNRARFSLYCEAYK